MPDGVKWYHHNLTHNTIANKAIQKRMFGIRLQWVYAIAAALLLGFAVTSCRAPKDVTYFSNLQNEQQQELSSVKNITVRPGDRLSILVVSKDPQLMSLFNLPVISQRLSQPGVTSAQRASNDVASYVVDHYGDIQFPVLGKIHIGGMQRSEVADYIAKELLDRNLIKDPTVIVDFLNNGVVVLGEVNKPGRVTFDRDQFTLLDALAGAGDLTIQGQRKDVLVTRTDENGNKTSYRVDLTDAEKTMQSPAFYMQQDDVVYVSPNDVRKRQTTANGNAPLTPSFWISIASLATTVAVLVFK